MRTTSRPSHVARSSISASTASVIGARERLVLVDGVDAQHALVTLGGGVELADQPVAVQDRQRVVAPDPLGLRLVHLQHVVELEERVEPLAVHHQPVERRQQRRAALEVVEVLEVRRVDPPLPAHALDHGRLAGVAGRTSARRGPRARSGGRCPSTAAGGGPAPRAPRRDRAAARRRTRARPGPTASRARSRTRRRPRRAGACTRASAARSCCWSSRSSPTCAGRCRAAGWPAADPPHAGSRGCPGGTPRWPRTSRPPRAPRA